MCFQSSLNKLGHVPSVFLEGKPILYKDFLKYLGHILSSDSCDDLDIAAQVRALYIRSNGIIRRFCHCNTAIKIRLFQAYCFSIYGSDVWINYSVKKFNRLRIA